MQLYDLLMLALMAGAILFGLWKGLAWQIASLAAIIVSYFVAINFRGPLAGLIKAEPPWDRFLAMLILFIGTSLVVWLLFGFVKRTIERLHLKTFDRQVGGLLGAFKGAILCIIVTLFAVTLLGDGTRQTICTSKSGNVIAHALAKLDGIVPSELGQYIDPYIDKFNDAMQQHQSVDLGSQGQGTFSTGQGTFATNSTGAAIPGGFPNHVQPNNQGITVGPVERLGQLQPTWQNQNIGEQQYNAASRTWGSVAPNPSNTGIDSAINWERAANAVMDAASRLGQPNR